MDIRGAGLKDRAQNLSLDLPTWSEIFAIYQKPWAESVVVLHVLVGRPVAGSVFAGP